MNHPRHEPLTPEERALAERLARIGPHDDGPPPSLDAKILAAAHAAVAPTSRRRRWLALTSVPASLITGVGMAAALALVVGVVWQLRPASGPARAPRGEADDMGYVSAEMIQRERPPAPTAPPPPPEAPVPPSVAARSTAPAPAKALSAPPVEARRQAVAAAAMEEPAPAQASNAAAEAYLDEAVVDAPAPAAPAGYVRARAPRSASAAPPAATVMASPAASESDFVPAPPAPSAPSADMAQRKAVAAEGEAKARAEADSTRELAAKQSSQLDRIEVTGTRIALADVPVREDARLPIEDWLQRIRQRRDGGDLDGARNSLMLFRREHPHHRVPDDLRALPASEPGR